MEKVKVRIAPSPTGYLHIGTARTALFNWLFAERYKKLGYDSKLILRIEDTDLERSDKKYEEDIIKGLEWLGLKWDGEIFYQSKRLDIYKKYLKKLLESEDKKAFWCYHTKEELEAEQKEQMAKHEAPRHICDHKDKQIKGRGGVIRLNVGLITHTLGDKIDFYDLVRNTISWDGVEGIFGDFVIAKNENSPLYNFAAVVDDIEMKITHVIRGEDHISNTPKQILIQQALQIPSPKYAHLPLILGPDKSKLSGRHGAMSVNEYREIGYLPEALVNFLALLGWNPGTEKEIFSLKELVKEFDITKIQKGGAIFNTVKLDWLNGYYIRQMPINELTKKVIPFLMRDGLIESDYNFEYIKKVVLLEQPRLKKLSEIGEKGSYFFKSPDYPSELLVWRDMLFKDVVVSLNVSFETLSVINEDDFNRENVEKNLLKESERAKNKDKGRLLWPLRAALTGLDKSPGPFEILEILGKTESLERIERAIKKLA